MKNIFRFLFGLNGASVIRGFRLGPGELMRAGLKSLSAAHPFEKRDTLSRGRVRDAFNQIPVIHLGGAIDVALQERKSTVQIEIVQYEDGRLPIHDTLALLALAVAENPGEVLEIGTYMGYTTRALAENLPHAIIHTVDLPPDFTAQGNDPAGIPKDDFHLIQRRVVGREFKGRPAEAGIRQHFGDTALMDFREFGHPNFFFIDGSHTYEYCKQDSEKCLALCQGNGTFLWHDCDDGHPGVIQFISEWRAAGRNIFRIDGTSLAYWKHTASSIDLK